MIGDPGSGEPARPGVPARWRAAFSWGAAARWLLAGVIVTASALPIVWQYLITWPQDQWLVDLEVYREAGRSIIYGRPIYDMLTEPPQLLPFTYPPFAALLALPLTLVSFAVAGWIWTIAQIVATFATVWIAARPLLRRTGRWAPVVCGLLTAALVRIQPVSDGIRFGQVNAFIVLVCLIDLAAVRARWPRGLLIGIVAAIKLTPGIFFVYFAVTRRWREARGVLLGAVGATLFALFALPEASLAYWGGALEDPNRLGPNGGTSNQSINGVLLRIGAPGPVRTVVWLALAVLVIWAGVRIGRLAHAQGDRVAEVGAIGLLATLVSPVAWIHHMAWLVVVICALIGDGRSLRRWVYAGVITAFFIAALPFRGIRWVGEYPGIAWFGRIVQNSDTFGALVALGLLWLVLRRTAAEVDGSGGSAGSDGDVDAGGLQPGEDGEEQADTAADPADRGELDPAK